MNVKIGRSGKYGGDSDTFTKDRDHMKRCDELDAIEATRCPTCKGRGKVPYTFGSCTECGGNGHAMACFKHKFYWF